MTSSTLESKIILLSQLESERDEMRRQLEQICQERHNLEQKMKNMEAQLMGIDNDIDDIESEVETIRNMEQQDENIPLSPQQSNEKIPTTILTTIMSTNTNTTTPIKHDENLTEYTQTPSENHRVGNNFYIPRVSTESIGSLQFTSTIDCTKSPLDFSSVYSKASAAVSSSRQNTLDMYINQAATIDRTGTVHRPLVATTTNTTRFPWTDEVNNLLRTKFKIQAFRDHQKDIIDATLSGKDVFVIMRTGGGKSLTYQLPALLEGRGPSKKVTFVVSPLLSLIQDQEEQMNEFAPGSATSFTSGLQGGNTEHARRWAMVRDPNQGVCLVFITPEKVNQSNKLCSEMEKLFAQGRLGRFVIDECHCACQWGHDFRPDYAQLGKLKAHFPSIPVIAVTATASQQVRQDVCQILRIGTNYSFFRSTANRPNLQYSIRPKPDGRDPVMLEMVEFIKQNHPSGAGIVYACTKKEADVVAHALCSCGIKAKSYHSEISAKEKESIHRSWMRNNTQVVVATIAFGLGINKPDVRFVLHHSISKTLEAYYQESGRAGRDGKPSDCVLFYSPKDFPKLLKMVHGSSSERLLFPMIRYAQASGNDALCKALILNHLGEPDSPSIQTAEMQNEGITTMKREIGSHAKNVVQLLNLRLNEGENVTAAMLSKDWRTTGANTPDFIKDNPPAKDNLSADDCDRIIINLILENVIQTSPVWNAYDTIIYLALGPLSSKLLNASNPKIYVKLPIRTAKVVSTAVAKAFKAGGATPSNGKWLTTKRGMKTKTPAKKTVKKRKGVTTKVKRKGTTTATKKPSRKAAPKRRFSAPTNLTDNRKSTEAIIEILSDYESDYDQKDVSLDDSSESENEF